MAATSRYRWNQGHRIAYLDKVDPETFASCLLRLRERTGDEIPARDVVEEARREDADIHPLFEWDDNSAAEEYRLHQARNALNSLRVVRITASEEVEERIAYIHVQEPVEGRHVYVSADIVAQRSDYQEQAIAEALRYLAGFQRRYRHMQELEPLIEAVEQAMAQYAPQATKAAAS